MSDDASPGVTSCSSRGGTAATCTVRSMRSRSGPDKRERVARHLRRRAPARTDGSPANPHGQGFIAPISMKRAGKITVLRGARDPHAAFLERLAQHLEHVPAELRHLVEEEHAVMREADFPGPRMRSAADQRDVRYGVMRRAERPLGQAAASRAEQARHRVDRRRLERLVEGQRRQDRRHAPRHHRLAGAGRADEQHVVPAGGRDLERAARERLALDVGEIDIVRRSGDRAAMAVPAPPRGTARGSFNAAMASASDRTG